MSDTGVDPTEPSQRASKAVSQHVLLRPEIDRAFEMLADHHRRLVLSLLKRGTVETTNDVVAQSSYGTKEFELTLRHNHLPKLAQAGYIEWDRETGALSEGPRFEEIEPFVELLSDHASELTYEWP